LPQEALSLLTIQQIWYFPIAEIWQTEDNGILSTIKEGRCKGLAKVRYTIHNLSTKRFKARTQMKVLTSFYTTNTTNFLEEYGDIQLIIIIAVNN